MISSSLMTRSSVKIRKPNSRAVMPSTTSTNRTIARYVTATSLSSGSSDPNPKLATVTAINAHTPIGA